MNRNSMDNRENSNLMSRKSLWSASVMLALAAVAGGQVGHSQNTPDAPPPPPMQSNRPPMERAFHGHGGGPGREGMGRWWDNPQVAKDLNLDTGQKQKMDDIFQQNRLKIIDLHANLQKQEAILEPLVGADAPDENKVLSQIDKVAAARADLEKSNARMLLEIRQVLSPDQWTKLKAARTARMGRGPGDHGPGPDGSGPGMGGSPGPGSD